MKKIIINLYWNWCFTQLNQTYQQYKTLSLQEHQNFVIQNTGLHINPEFPYLGKSSDGLIQWHYHVNSVLEIKYPHNYRYGLKKIAARQKFLYWWQLSNKNWLQYYYQIQGQMFILNLGYCDFSIWSTATPTDYPDYLKIYVEKNDVFINDMSVKLQNYFFKVLLPEVVKHKTLVLIISKNFIAFAEDHVLRQWLLLMLNTVILTGIITHV